MGVGRYFQCVGHKTDGFPVLVMENVPFAVFSFRWRMNLREFRHVADAAARVIWMFAFPLRIGNDKPRTGSVGFHWVQALMVNDSAKRMPSARPDSEPPSSASSRAPSPNWRA